VDAGHRFLQRIFPCPFPGEAAVRWRRRQRDHVPAEHRRRDGGAAHPASAYNSLRDAAAGCTACDLYKALLGPSFRVTKQRGEFVDSPLAPKVTATVHPSSILRAPDDEARRLETARFIADLKKVAAVLR
jgi:uracil-DNA glycosylase